MGANERTMTPREADHNPVIVALWNWRIFFYWQGVRFRKLRCSIYRKLNPNYKGPPTRLEIHAAKRAAEERAWFDDQERLFDDEIAEEAERRADPAAVRAAAHAEEAAHNQQLARSCPPDWRVVAIYEDCYDEKGWLCKYPTGRFSFQAPGGFEAILDLENWGSFPTGWSAEKKWIDVCYDYTITTPNGDRITFFDNWNA